MVDLAAVTRRDVRFGYLEDTRVRYAEQACGPQPIAPFTRAATLPAHATAIGHVRLAFSPPAVVSSITNHGLAPYTPFTPTTALTLGRALSAVRLRGVAVVSGQLSPDHAAVAAPVFGPGRSIVSALEVRLHNVVEDLRGVVPALTVAARGLSRELAHIPVDNANSIGTVSSLGRECTRTA
jgi:DNA-binding IclR family transcriptional regulator